MKSALEELSDKLSLIGMSDQEINMLLGRFLQEEAYDYIECMELIEKKLSTNKKSSFYQLS